MAEFLSTTSETSVPGLLAGMRVVVAALVPATGDEDQPRLDALRLRVEMSGGTAVGMLVQRRGASRERRPGRVLRMRTRVAMDSATLLGRGKVAELAAMVQTAEADMVVFLNPLTGTQKRNLEQATGVTVLSGTED